MPRGETPDERRRLESRLDDARQALAEARSADVRAFLAELCDTYETELGRLTGVGGEAAAGD